MRTLCVDAFVNFHGIMQDLSAKLLKPCSLPKKHLPATSSHRRHSLPKSNIDEQLLRRLQRLLENPIMQQNNSTSTRQRQRLFIEDRIKALGGMP